MKVGDLVQDVSRLTDYYYIVIDYCKSSRKWYLLLDTMSGDTHYAFPWNLEMISESR